MYDTGVNPRQEHIKQICLLLLFMFFYTLNEYYR